MLLHTGLPLELATRERLRVFTSPWPSRLSQPPEGVKHGKAFYRRTQLPKVWIEVSTRIRHGPWAKQLNQEHTKPKQDKSDDLGRPKQDGKEDRPKQSHQRSRTRGRNQKPVASHVAPTTWHLHQWGDALSWRGDAEPALVRGVGSASRTTKTSSWSSPTPEAPVRWGCGQDP